MTHVKSTIDSVQGFSAAGVHAGLKKAGKRDFALIVSDRACAAAGIFTTNAVKAACVLVDMDKLHHSPDTIRAVAINTRSANACTGEQGIHNAHITSGWVADVLGCTPDDVLVLSTGVIGMQLPMDKIKQGIELTASDLSDDWQSAAEAIMTTDTRPKMASVTVTRADGSSYQIAGISKGAGMIAPNMATMLGIIVTDAALTVEQAQTTLTTAANFSYNRIVVDGDMSTNDTVFLLANGASEAAIKNDEEQAEFQAALTAVCRKLAQDIVRDGEGVTKFITLHITGAVDDVSARQIGMTIATSPLVKTAFYGNDANWGRILMAAGRSGIELDSQVMSLSFAPGETMDGALKLFEGGMPTDYQEAEATAIIKHDAVCVHLDCGQGDGETTIWTCDLSHEYVSVNADYRT